MSGYPAAVRSATVPQNTIYFGALASVPPSMPPDRRIDEAVAALSARGESVAVVRLVEWWSAGGTPTVRGRFCAARAFFDLRMLDRSILRVREVLDAAEPGSPQHTDALALLVEVCLERGWKERARAPLTQLAAAESPLAASLAARAEQPFTPPESGARQIERTGTGPQLIALAERFCATGSFTRATGILERLRRQEPGNARASALLWGLAGDMGAGPPIEDLMALAVPSLALPSLELPDDPEHTESVDVSERARLVAELAEEPADRNFPSLFKFGAAAPAAEDAGERTATSGMASEDDMLAGGAEGTDAGVVALAGGSGSGDTQILLVLRPGEDMQAHRRREEADRLRETFNLREYQASMGMSTGPDLADDALEEEDESIVLLGRSEAPVQPAPEPAPAAPIEVVDPHPPPTAPPPQPPAAAPRRTIHPLWVGAVLLVLLLLGLAVAALALPALLVHARGSARAELLNALSADELPVLLATEPVLKQRHADAELAELDLVVWAEFDGDPARLTEARRILDEARLDAHRRAMLTAQLELALGHARGAVSAVGLEQPQDDEERWLMARIALAQAPDAAGSSGADRANDLLAELEEPGAPRYRLARARALAAAGLTGPSVALVNAVLAASPLHAGARVMAMEALPDGPSRADAARALQSDTTLEPRLAGRASATRVRALLGAGLGPALSLAREGLQRDGQNVDLLLVVADDAQARGRALEALGTLEGIPVFDERVWIARVLTLLQLDRVVEADAAVTEHASESPDVAQTLRAVVAGSAGGQASVPEGPVTPLRAAAQALSAVQALSPDALAAVDAAVVPVDTSEPGAGFLLALQRRVRALRVGLVPASALTPETARLLDCCAQDPAAHVALGRAYEQAGNRALAAQHFDRAVVLGSETAMAWYERGRFYEDAGDGLSRSSQSWHSYLALAPSGARAERVAERVASAKVP